MPDNRFLVQIPWKSPRDISLDGPIDWSAVFERDAPLRVEIGFGKSEFLMDVATREPSFNYVGFEYSTKRVGAFLRKLERRGIENVRAINENALQVLPHIFTPGSLDRLYVLFPDPWPKKRHAKRRIIQPEFVENISGKLKSNGCLHLATDWLPYAEHMIDVLEKVPSLSNAAAPNAFWENPNRPETKFEKRGKNLGNKIWDLLYRKD